jgi:hypothetical protein
MKEGKLNNQERTSGLSETVGLTEEENHVAREDSDGAFNEQFFEDWEREKTPEEREIIQGIISKLPEFVKRFDGKPLPLIEDHVHVVDENKVSDEVLEMLKKSPSSYGHDAQGMIISYADTPGDPNRLEFAHKVIHEMLHFLSFQSVHKIHGKEMLTERRNGFSVRVSGGTEFYFDEVDEALIQEAVMMFDEEYFSSIPVLSEDLKKREEAKQKLRAEGQFDADMVSSVNKNGDPNGYVYSEEMYQLRNLIHNIYLSNPDKISSEDEVKNEFLRTVFTGKLLKVAKMVEHWGGKGAFRRLGDITKRDRGKKED